MKKRIRVEQLANNIGEIITENAFVLDSMNAVEMEQKTRYAFVLSDRTGEASGDSLNPIDETLVGKVVMISGVVNIHNGETCIRITSIRAAKPSEYVSSELFNGVSDETIEALLNKVIYPFINTKIKDSVFRELLQAAWSKENIAILRERPATLADAEALRGGAIVLAAVVTRMSANLAVAYNCSLNGIYNCKLNTDLIVAAGLLSTIGTMRFYTDYPNPKRQENMFYLGYNRVTQMVIDDIISKNNIKIDAERYGQLISCIGAMSPHRDLAAKETLREGLLLSQIHSLYSRLDNFDHCISETELSEAEKNADYIYRDGMYIPVKLVTTRDEGENE